MISTQIIFKRILLAFYFIEALQAIKYAPCPFNDNIETRRLFIATCDTRTGRKEFNALKLWNVTSNSLRGNDKSKVVMENVCRGENWGKFGFLTKPLLYVNHLKEIMKNNPADGHLNHIILMDSDTFWSAGKLSTIWNKYDCARGQKNMVLSTEMSCWVGRFCTAEDLNRWYSNATIAAAPSYSPFANSGVIMGRVDSVIKMLEYVIANNGSYFITYHAKKGPKFDDQYAIADYAIKVAPEEVSLDYHQQIAASFSVHAPTDPGWPFVCKDQSTGMLATSCHNWTKRVARLGHFEVNAQSTECFARRKVNNGMFLQEELESLAPDPLIWHGNGAGKNEFRDVGYNSYKCFLNKWNVTEEQYANTCGSHCW